MPIIKQCEKCWKEFSSFKYRPAKYCTRECYLLARFYRGGKCVVCGKKARISYCSERCRKDYWNKNGYSKSKKKYFWDKKFELIKSLGGKCIKCGVDDVRCLDLNHIDRTKKGKHKNYSWHQRFKEWANQKENLELLCANCHRIHTWSQMGYGKF